MRHWGCAPWRGGNLRTQEVRLYRRRLSLDDNVFRQRVMIDRILAAPRVAWNFRNGLNCLASYLCRRARRAQVDLHLSACANAACARTGVHWIHALICSDTGTRAGQP
jgi:hypothetical protein